MTLENQLKEAFDLNKAAIESQDKNAKIIRKFVDLVKMIKHQEFASSKRVGVSIDHDYKIQMFCQKLLDEVGYYEYDQIKGSHKPSNSGKKAGL